MAKLEIGIGFHTAAACYCDGIGDYLSGVASDGHVITAKSVDSTSSLMDFQKEIKSGARGYAVYRCLREYDVPNYGARIKDEARKYVEKIDEFWPPELDKSLFYVELINEPDRNQADWLGHFLCELAQQMMDSGYNFAGPGWSPGEPEPADNRTPGMLAWFTMVAANTGRLAHAVHEYAFDNTMESQRPWQMGRVSDINSACYENGISLPDILITEFGWSYRSAPNWQDGVPQIVDQIKWYLANTPNVRGVHLWALDKSSQWADISGTINPYMTPLIVQTKTVDWAPPRIPLSPVVNVPTIPHLPESDHIKFVEYLYPQEATNATYNRICDQAWNDYKRSVGGSVDHAIAALSSSVASSESYVVVFDSHLPSQEVAMQKLDDAGITYQTRQLEHDAVANIQFAHWPCDTRRIVQRFGARPEVYRKFGLPGHEGIDLAVGAGQPYYAVQDGVVVYAGNKRPDGGLSNYGWHCYIRHDGFHTVYAHGKSPVPVNIGQRVTAGQIIGYSGNSGNSTGYHLHFGVLVPVDTGNGYPMWKFGQCVNPASMLASLNPQENSVKSPSKIDMVDYLRGDGRLYEVEHAGGGNERFQTQAKPDKEFWQTKNNLAEQLRYDGDWIYRGWDTSPGGGRYYRQEEPKGTMWARWLPRFMSPGQTFSVPLWVQFYTNDGNESQANSGSVQDTRLFVAHHDSWTSQSGITLDDVVEIEWVNGGELYFYARNFGLVGWSRKNPDPNTPAWSGISEVHGAGQRPDNVADIPPQLI